MPHGIYSRLNCIHKKEEAFTPLKHQTDTQNYFLQSPYKGLLLYHKLGSGKTCTSIMIADKMLEEKKVKHVYILTPGSLRSGWVGEYCQKCGNSPQYLKNNYTFITYNYMVADRIPDFSETLVIIDEVHNLINGVKNLSKHPVAIYNKIKNSSCRVLALSGTPIYNYIYEFGLLGTLLKPEEFSDIRKNDKIVEKEFMKDFMINGDGLLIPKNETRVRRKMEGIVSYFPGSGKEFVPEVIYMPPIKCPMSESHERYYWERVEQELKLINPPSKSLIVSNPDLYKTLKKLNIVCLKKILSRSASNFNYSSIPKDKPDFVEEKGGWINKELFQNGALFKEFSTKITAFLTNLVLHLNQKHVLFTYFKVKSGVQLIKSILSMCGIKSAIFSGDLDDAQRKSLLKRFNSKENRYGDLIRILLVTEAGAEGISLLESRHMHILESSPRMSKTIQAIGRVARYKSHVALPAEERTIKVWVYWSVCSGNKIKIKTKIYNKNGQLEEVEKNVGGEDTIDVKLYRKGMATITSINNFLHFLKTFSVTPFVETD